MGRFFVVLSALLFAGSVGAQSYADRVVDVPLGTAKVVSLGGIAGAAELTDKKIASFRPYGANLLVYGRKIGETTLMVKNPDGATSWLIRVSMPAGAIQAELDKMFPEDRVTARALGGAIVLTGTVPDVVRLKQIEDVAMGYLKSPSFADLGVEPNVINLLAVRSGQQVQLEVKFAEVNRRSFREMSAGVTAAIDKSNALEALHTQRELGNGNGQTMFGGAGVGAGASALAGDQSSGLAGTGPVRALPAANSFGTFFFGTQFGSFPFAATLNLLAQRSQSKTLAEPTLVAMSGEEASFLAGGEVPVIQAGGINGNSITYKPFGVQLSFSPTVLSDQTIQLRTTVALSSPEITLERNGNIGFRRRSSETTVRLQDGQSFAIAGLLQDEINKITAKMPGLAEIPILGLLFKSKSFTRSESELVVVVTVRLVDPLEQGQLPPLPGASGPTDPTDLQMFFLNLDDPKSPAEKSATPRRRPSGRLGFSR